MSRPKKIDLVGQRFGKLIVLNEAEKINSPDRSYNCRCDCGNYCIIRCSELNNGKTKSCGCLRRITTSILRTIHGDSKKKNTEYNSWMAMKQRCYNPKSFGYKWYGAKGITVCDRWLHSYENFLADMGRRPSPQHTIDRYPDNKGNYQPSNCRWATKREQRLNQVEIKSDDNAFIPIGITFKEIDKL